MANSPLSWRTLYRTHGCYCLGFITACNPFGQVMSDGENAAATAALHAELSVLGLPVFSAEGRDPAGKWRESSFAVLGLGLAEVRRLGERWRQNAVLWAGADAVPQLVLLQ